MVEEGPETEDEPRIMDTTDQPNSMCHVSTIQMFYQPPQPPSHQQPVHLPFAKLDGEGVQYNGKTVDGQITVTSYRLYLQIGDVHHLIPLGLIENVEHRELFYLHIGCKDARTFRCTFSNNETCLDWFEKLTKFIEPRALLEENFAFFNYVWVKHRGGPDFEEKLRNARLYTYDYSTFKQEMDRLQFEGDSWRISEANQDYKLCPSYPPYLIVPSCINDTMLEAVAKFRSSRRIPAVVWRHVKNGAVIARSSQPEVGWLGWRSSEDEDLLKAISQACSFDQRNDKESILSHSPGSIHSEDSLQITSDITAKEKKVLILDARSYTTAVANRARGGGCECPEYYPNCDIMFMNLANIHSIRKSFQALRLLCTGPMDLPNWHSQLEGTRWMQHMSVLMKAAFALVKAVEREARPVLVHCSDGWDRTPQIVALSQLMLDPYYRTIDGFRILIEREWLAFGHKFADRCGHAPNGDTNERCPVFLQWLDCVHQLLDQFQCAFEFSQSYLVKLAHHVYSNLYGTFLCNTYQERMNVVYEKTFAVWDFLNAPHFKNHLYAGPGNSAGLKVLWPQCNIRDLRFWQEMYLGSLESNHGTGSGSGSCPGPPESSPSHMTKTRSYGDLINAADVGPSQIRRSSDPSINIDKKLVISQESNSPTQDIVSAHTANNSTQQQEQLPTSENGDFLSNESDDVVDCNKDCIYKNVNGAVDKPTFKITAVNSGGVNGATNGHFLRDNVINGEKTDESDECVDDVREVLRNACLNDDLTPSYNHSNEIDSDNEVTEMSESKSENTVCDLGMTERLETSTDTLVSESHNISSSPLEVHGFEKLQSPEENGYKLCAQNLKLGEVQCDGIPQLSKECISPVYSRASSSSGWDTGLPQHRPWHQTHPFNLGEDGLVPVTSVAQERLWQIIQEQRRKEELLEKELHTYRQALLKQSCHRCNNNDNEKIDDAGSVVESICSAGEGQASAVESLRSDLSWEAVEDNCSITECTATLWVPDHAVSRCTGCQTEFWVGKRKHHCRKCGRIFCASCSENSTPLPSEQLYNPVRVCTGCFSKLRRDCGEVPDQCKHSNGQPTNSNPQITASSN